MPPRKGLRGSTFARGSRWVVSFPLPPTTDPDTGKRRYPKITETYTTEADATARLIELNHQHRTGQFVPPDQQTLGEYMEEWLAGRKVRPSTLRRYRYDLKLIAGIGDVPLRKLDALVIERWHAWMVAQGYSTNRQRCAHERLSSALRAAHTAGRITHNPAAAVPAPKHRQQPTPAMTPDEARRFLATAHATPSPVIVPLVWDLLLATGLRIGEALALRWSDLDTDRRQLHVRRTVTRDANGKAILGDAPKTDASERRVPLRPDMLDALRAHRATQNERRLRLGQFWQDNDLVFAGQTGNLVDPVVANRRMAVILKAAELPHFTPHSLRHTAARLMRESGAMLETVRDVLGHSTLAQTADTYGRTSETARRDAVEMLGDLLEREG